MAETLYEQIAEEAKLVDEETINEGEDHGEDDGGSNDESVRGQDRRKQGARSEQGSGKDSGSGRRRGSREDASRGESGASSEDAGASSGTRGDAQGAGGGAQEDASAPQEDGEDVLKAEKPPTNADFARLRREARELKAKLAKYEAEKPAAEPRQPEKPVEVKTDDATEAKEPDKNVNYQEWLEWKLAQADNTIQENAKLVNELREWKADQAKDRELERLTTAAVDEFQRIENSYKAHNADYDNAIAHARQRYADAVKIMYPDKTEAQIESAIDQQMLRFASDCAVKGLNPAEELYDMAIERFGYIKQEAVEDEEPKAPLKQKERPNLKVIANNRRKSASPLSGGGQGGRLPLTQESAADMSMGEFSRLSPEDLAALEAM